MELNIFPWLMIRGMCSIIVPDIEVQEENMISIANAMTAMQRIESILLSFEWTVYLRWTQVPRLFAVLFTMTTFCQPKWPRWLFAVFFWLLTELEGKKRLSDFLLSFWWLFAVQNSKKDSKRSCSSFVLQKDAKKTPKGRRANFVLQLVGNHFWTQKVA